VFIHFSSSFVLPLKKRPKLSDILNLLQSKYTLDRFRALFVGEHGSEQLTLNGAKTVPLRRVATPEYIAQAASISRQEGTMSQALFLN
jgi:hypothetical protein